MFRLKSTILPAFITLTLSAAACLHAQDRMRTGLWEVTTTNEGKPASAPHSSCFTPAMVELANTAREGDAGSHGEGRHPERKLHGEGFQIGWEKDFDDFVMRRPVVGILKHL